MAGAEYVWLCQVKNHCASATGAVAQAPDLDSKNSHQPDQTRPGVSESDSDSVAIIRTDDSPAEPDTNPIAIDKTAEAVTTTTTAPTETSRSTSTPVNQQRPAPLTLTVAGKTLYASEPFGFSPNQWELNKAQNGQKITAEIVQTLSQNQALEITIAGQYRTSETAPQGHSNMGLARAQSLSDALVNEGIARDRMTRSSVVLTDDRVQPGYVLSAVDFSGLLEAQIMYFDTASAAPRSGPNLGQFIGEVTEFLQTHRGASIRVTGHTDNTGVTGDNDELGLSRARQAAEQLAAMGLPSTRIRIGSKGQNQPVADNSTAVGRAANRRVEIQLDMGRR